MGLFGWLLSKWRKPKQDASERKQEEKSFYQYIMCITKVLTYFRRDAGISRKNLELVVVDEPEQPAWQIHQILEQLIPELNLLYLITDRPEAYEELVEEALEDRGLILTLMSDRDMEKMPGNLVLDLRDWQMHLDIINQPRYNF